MSTSIPPPSGGGSSRYAIIGVLLLLAAGIGIYFATRGGSTTASGTQPASTGTGAGVDVAQQQAVLPQIGAQIILPDEEPDAGLVAEGPGDGSAGGRHIRYITHYINECPGSIDPTRVAAVVRQNYGGLRECYNRQLRLNPTLRGSVTARWVINTNGTVGQIATSGSVTRDRQFKSCFEGALSRLRFPPPSRGCATFEQSFSFTPGE